jgi:hypothetical protein
MTVLEELRAAGKDNLREAFYWFVFSVFGSLLPIVVSTLLFGMWGKWPGFDFFFSHGEYYIYGASFLCPALYILWRIANIKLLTMLALVLLVGAVTLFAGALATTTPGFAYPLQQPFLKYTSYCVLFCSMLIAWVTKVIENMRLGTDLATESSEAIDKLGEDFDKLEA